MEKIRKRFQGKVAIVTASTQGIGFAIAERLSLEGVVVVISSHRQSDLQKNVDAAVEKLKGKRIEAMGLVCHVSNAQHRKNLIDKTVEKYRKIDVIVCNAAANPPVNKVCCCCQCLGERDRKNGDVPTRASKYYKGNFFKIEK